MSRNREIRPSWDDRLVEKMQSVVNSSTSRRDFLRKVAKGTAGLTLALSSGAALGGRKALACGRCTGYGDGDCEFEYSVCLSRFYPYSDVPYYQWYECYIYGNFVQALCPTGQAWGSGVCPHYCWTGCQFSELDPKSIVVS